MVTSKPLPMNDIKRCPVSDQTFSEEVVNVITHGLGAVLACAGTISIVKHAWLYGTGLHVFTTAVYAIAWIILFSCSTLYHYSRCLERKWHLRCIDHCAIFVVIAASYGPFMAHLVGGTKGYGMWIAAWVVAVVGILFKLKSRHRYGSYAVFGYLLQGWMVMLVFPAIYTNLSAAGLVNLFTCGFLISGGSALYNRESIPYHHGIWHMCVLIGSICLYYCVLHSILPGPLPIAG